MFPAQRDSVFDVQKQTEEPESFDLPTKAEGLRLHKIHLLHQMSLATSDFQLPLLATQLPALPEGPALDNVRGPIEATGGYALWQITLAALAALLIAGFFIWLYRRARTQPPAPIDPQATALAELEAAPQAADDERFALLCANALRRFLAARFDLPASSQTSAELCAHLPLPGEDRSRISALLERCDGVKFARQALSPDQRKELLDTAGSLIRQLERKEIAAT